jgi:beta-carotene 15,15'-dioxygenase
MSEKIDKKYELNTNIIFLFIIIAAPLLLLNYGDILSKNFLPTPVCLFLILTIGVSHGALDNIKGNKVLKYYEIQNKIIFYFAYMLLASFVIMIWAILPTFTLTLFLIIAAYHFGKEDCWGIPINKSILLPFNFFLKGSLIIWAPLFLNFDETIAIFNTLGIKNIEFYNFLNILKDNYILLILVTLSILSNVLINMYPKYLARYTWEIILILVLYDTFNPLIAFTVYFCFLHSTRHSVSLTYDLKINMREFIKKALPLTIVTAIFFLFSLYILTGFKEADIDSSIISIIFIGLASLTFPHILLEYLVEKNGK